MKWSRGRSLQVVIWLAVLAGFAGVASYRQYPVVGPDHWSRATGDGLRALAEGRLGDADRSLTDALEHSDSLAGADYRRGTSYQNLGDLRCKQMRWQDAADLYERALPLLESNPNPSLPQIGLLLNEFGWVETKLGRWDRAESLLRRAVQIREQAAIAPADRAVTLDNLAIVLVARGRGPEAGKYAARARAIRASSAGVTSTRRTEDPD